MRRAGLVLVLLGTLLALSCGGRPADPVPAVSVPAGARTADRDLIGLQELAKAEDPSFDSVAAYLPAMKKPREAVGVKHHPAEIGIAPDASLEISEDASVAANPKAWFEAGEPASAFGSGASGCRKSLVEDAPVVAAEWEHDGARFRQTV
ncbi:MAG TPA: hypothetical protein VLN41_00785, partial [Candidatus Bathyarchaeia archaeon]|nr:hypothetical protein [Candidatus Bathyarchaeia archaeon]